MNKFTLSEVIVRDLETLDILAQKIARCLKGSEVIELCSDLGGGKTAFVRSLAAHLPLIDRVSSPSFTIENVYRGKRFDIHHFDFYRLEDAGICAFELSEALADPKKVVIIEWSRIVADLLPPQRLIINIEFDPADKSARSRLFTFKTPPSLNYLTQYI